MVLYGRYCNWTVVYTFPGRSPQGHKAREQYSYDLNVVNLVLYSRRDEVWKIADFDISTTGTSHAQTTRQGRGTSGYRSPELIGSQKQTFTNKVDIWGLGSILYRLAYDAKIFEDDFAVREWSIVAAPLPFSIHGPISGNNEENRADVSIVQKLISSMLLREPETRPTARDLLSIFTRAARSSHNLQFPHQEETNVSLYGLASSGERLKTVGSNGTCLLIWIDDEQENNIVHIRYAMSRGIVVKSLYSTAEAMNWINQNSGIFESP